MKHYILIEVRERDDRKYGSDAGDIRKAIHEFCKERGIKFGDMIFREDRIYIPFTRTKSPYLQIRETYESIMNQCKEIGLFKPKKPLSED